MKHSTQHDIQAPRLPRNLKFENCNLREAVCADADLGGVVFWRCDLTRADLRGSKLAGADLRGSIIDGMQAGAPELKGLSSIRHRLLR